ncbi:inactive ubiquitin carboxyl-terminal hydrolase 54-like isoform X2 [Oscarella lobularis]|uniref:inactive ubiquitin carboxyl-terminal hydrolase 54-like isoform X2 n=1 Tax=Oscarella lobularis TaxID=121494 RepID=UPI0033143CB9
MRKKMLLPVYFRVYRNTFYVTSLSGNHSQLIIARIKATMSARFVQQTSVDSVYQTMGPLSNKGLKNPSGDNNCFLNSSIQILWHLDVFRRSFRHVHVESPREKCQLGKACVVCSLEVMFTQYQHSQMTVLPPDVMRQAMAHSFAHQNRFQLGVMDDGAECYEHILSCVHRHLNPREDDTQIPCTLSHCITHRKFAMDILENYNCSFCQSTSEPFVYEQIINYVSVFSLIAQHTANSKGSRQATFGENLYKSGSSGQYQVCQNPSCRQFIGIQKTLLNQPDVLSIGLVWDTDCASKDQISQVAHMIDTSIRLSEVSASNGREYITPPRAHLLQVFNTAHPSTREENEYVLVALMAYYGMHYSTYCFHTKQEAWIYFDDSRFRKVGSSWDLVVKECLKGHYQPLLLVYARRSATPVPRVDAAPPVPRVDAAPPVPRVDAAPPPTTTTTTTTTMTRSVPSAPPEDLMTFHEPETESGGVDATKDDKTDDLIATAQEKERAGDLDGALDSYAQAFKSYNETIARLPAESSLTTVEEKRDRCRLRAKSLARKLGIHRQKTVDKTSREFAATPQTAPKANAGPATIADKTVSKCELCGATTLYLVRGMCALCRYNKTQKRPAP